jgi:hypothetical protein
MQLILAFLALAVVLNINVSEAKLSSVIRAKSTEKYNDYKVLAAAAAAPAAKRYINSLFTRFCSHTLLHIQWKSSSTCSC